MTLKEYLERNRINQADFAVKIGVSQQTVSTWASHENMPRRAELLRIYHETGGEVTPNDFVIDSEQEIAHSRTHWQRVYGKVGQEA